MSKVFIHIVCWNNADTIEEVLKSLTALEGFKLFDNLMVSLLDNCSTDGTREIIQKSDYSSLQVELLSQNIGFAAGVNRGVRKFLDLGFDFFLTLNPDAKLAPSALAEMIRGIMLNPNFGFATPKMLLDNGERKADSKELIDSAGIVMTPFLRHFDRGQYQVDNGQYNEPAVVFGGTGACLLIKRECVLDLICDNLKFENDKLKVYPQLSDDDCRAQLFDEAFFAYREDAELAWRANLFGWQTIYLPKAVVYHKRRVTPEKRASLDPFINKLGVKNRFLLQLNLFYLSTSLSANIFGLFLRNMIVFLALFFKEQTSLPALYEVTLLLRRALERRAYYWRRKKRNASELSKWFSFKDYVEKLVAK
ncbi:MAG TPA: glycosyltransferase family 2 protein [Oligoflexia bacterium]|nr:glycosyltransferase family 2 protein [Oligoflexia bacterium]HMP26827.1 glycosyltransferase family 2 protein [Oligoflexia bacterium]